jgi:hypothetical protein
MNRLLVECGEALYGERWQSALARDLGVSDRTMRRWAAGTHDVPGALYAELQQLTHKRAQRLDTIEHTLRQSLQA